MGNLSPENCAVQVVFVLKMLQRYGKVIDFITGKNKA